MKRIMLVFGTRPEAIKMCPLVLELRKRASLQTVVCVTAQHRRMLDQVLDCFHIRPDFDLDIMRDQQTLFDIIQQSAKLPVHLVQHVLVTRQPMKYLYHEPAAQARIDASRAGKTIRQILTCPRKRRALCKAMRDSFQWVDETVNLFNDFGDSFYFTTESGFPSNGGLVLFENTYDGHKGLCYQVCT